ncbi:MAG: hypothetical protein KAI79_05675, partial [Bacteroidales bacterium]|nr:hypothetical protein [Bacteroidales bacterium]
MKYTKLIISALILLFSINTIAQEAVKVDPPKLSPERKAAVDSLALEKVRDLSKYISIIGNKETPLSESARAIDRAKELFMEGSEIGVSSLSKSKVKYYTIEKYLYRLASLNYDKVNIDWFDIQYVSDLELQPDGRYVGVITIYQKFEGTTKEGLVYKDVTKKDVTVYVERKET